jgi:hypothetical protein
VTDGCRREAGEGMDSLEAVPTAAEDGRGRERWEEEEVKEKKSRRYRVGLDRSISDVVDGGSLDGQTGEVLLARSGRGGVHRATATNTAARKKAKTQTKRLSRSQTAC